jgi:hypothetical protein
MSKTGVTMGHPIEPGAGDGGSNPDRGKDLGYLVPVVEVAWAAPPSYGVDPLDFMPPPGEVPPPPTAIPQTSQIRMNTGSVRSSVNQMLNASRRTVAEYNVLRERVEASRNTAIWGQEATITDYEGGQSNVDGNSYNGVGAGIRREVTRPSPVREVAVNFAAEIGPMQEKALKAIADLLGTSGHYIASINRAGQFYCATDRRSRFPEPPSSQV